MLKSSLWTTLQLLSRSAAHPTRTGIHSRYKRTNAFTELVTLRVLWPSQHRSISPDLHRPRLHQHQTVRAALWDIGELVGQALRLGTSISVCLGIGLSLLPILTGESKEANAQRYFEPEAEERADNIRWGVMSVLSFVPFLNPMAWVFAAVDDETSSKLYWTFAAVYCIPYLASGLELDNFAFVALLLGILHIQIERIAQTEPLELELPEVLRSLLRALPRTITALGRYGSSIGGEVEERFKRSDDARRRRPDRKYLEEKSREARMELDEFDRKRRQRERDRQEK